MPAGYQPFYSLQDATGTATGRTADVGVSNTEVTLQINITGTATVFIEASEDGVKFVNVSNPFTGYTVSTIVVLRPIVTYYRARITSYSSGKVDAIIGPGTRAGEQLVNVNAARL